MASLDSAKGPSVKIRPFFPEAILPSCASGWPALALPWLMSRSNQAFARLKIFWISSGHRPLSQCVPRPSNRYSDEAVWVFISALLVKWFVPAQLHEFNDTRMRQRTNDVACVIAATGRSLMRPCP